MDENNALPEDISDKAENETEAVEVKDYVNLYNEMLDKYQRCLADFDNFRKRTTKEMMSRYEDGIRAAAAKFLPSLDNLERALDAHADKEDSFCQGISLILRGLQTQFEELGIKPIDTLPGTPFDAGMHNAVSHTKDENFGENQIAEVLQKGYLHKDKVLRHAMVIVAN